MKVASALDKEVFEAQNKLRTNPKSFIPALQKQMTYFKGNTIWTPGVAVGLSTNEGPSAW
jgi:hypothetical protein